VSLRVQEAGDIGVHLIATTAPTPLIWIKAPVAFLWD
jgi:hypothetical protein